eukprot:CAMPEP_0174693784 /NCGR_PEP_ID=MMETSP1094-20130205/428_1 /TAXON_ID=156173 /ORGANISM="Chrysochromulina brevifilum, Strain UTEX LB 985" /LENGTH=105 /DNA_ID=CAMNT_0015889795 /DNA_START=509 /DNA_END=823 /DNA_ORIENTATION=-
MLLRVERAGGSTYQWARASREAWWAAQHCQHWLREWLLSGSDHEVRAGFGNRDGFARKAQRIGQASARHVPARQRAIGTLSRGRTGIRGEGLRRTPASDFWQQFA